MREREKLKVVVLAKVIGGASYRALHLVRDRERVNLKAAVLAKVIGGASYRALQLV